MNRQIRFLLAAALVSWPAGVPSVSAGSRAFSGADKRYLEGIYRDTWDCISHFVHPGTGLPYDSHRPMPNTSITNIGFYMASCAVAAKTGILPAEEARGRLSTCLASLKGIEKWRGFPVTWVNAETGKTADRQFSTVDHLGNLCASLVLVKNIFPDMAPDVDEILSPMDWGVIYDPRNHLYRGGWRLDLNDFDVKQPWGDWYYGYLGADTRLGSFFGSARGQVPMDHWTALDRRQETKYGQSYYVPGWQGGGLFMQMVSGIFMDERETPLGVSAANFAYAQIIHASKIGAPVWGWSAAESPTGDYLGWGVIRDDVVTPHATVLAAVYYPRKAVENLKRLDELGARADYGIDGTLHRFGFRDSLDWKTGSAAPGYLMLDQTLLFLSLANVLYDGIVWEYFEKDPVVQAGRAMLPEYRRQKGVLDGYRRRDGSVPDETLQLKIEMPTE
ncbi:MAG TPA: glucoamylase family protein [Elusimicrobiota bacterium]|nr:glucoamylase family protein [Elusimicrobiota bacterium]